MDDQITQSFIIITQSTQNNDTPDSILRIQTQVLTLSQRTNFLLF